VTEERPRSVSQEYLDAGSAPFRPIGSYAMDYYEVQADVFEEPDVLAGWARKAFAAAARKRPGGTRKERAKKAGKKRQLPAAYAASRHDRP
jgi:TfoX/Sxy family transcriptional regulator of competence genes